MKSKAALFLEEARDYDAKDYMPKAMQWWSKLAPKQQKDYLAKLAKTAPDKVAQVYQDLYGTSPAADSHSEDMSKTKKVLAAAVLAAFMMAGSGAAHAIDYHVVGKDSKGNPIYATGGASSGTTQDKAIKTVDTAGKLLNVGAAAVGQFGNQHSSSRAYKASNDVNFVVSVLKALTGN
jgi:hypothetical protein